MHRIVLLIGSLSLALLSACTPEQQQVIDDITEPGNSGGCVIGGCSGQLCIEEGDDGVSTCEFREEYACYGSASCERQADGQCGWTQTDELTSCLQNPPSMMQGETEIEAPEDMRTRSMYSLYAPSVLVDGQTKVLFFHASWCPVCRKADDTLRGIYNQWDGSDLSFDELHALLPQYSVYKVDYDTEADLKAKYGVTYQHTFVLVDGQGNALKTIQGPSDAVLKELIGAKS